MKSFNIILKLKNTCRIIPSHCKVCFRIIWKQSEQLFTSCLTQKLENQSDSIRFISVQFVWIQAQINPHWYGTKIGLDQSELELIQIKPDSKSFSDLFGIIRNRSDSPGLNSSNLVLNKKHILMLNPSSKFNLWVTY